MKKILPMLLSALIAVAAVFAGGCEKKDDSPKVLRMATEAAFPPYEFIENGEIIGIDVDIVREIATNLGYKLVINNMKFASVLLAVQGGRCDIAASGLTVTEERKQQVSFTLPYVTAAQVIVVPKNSELMTPASLEDAMIRIGVQQGTTGDNYVTQYLHEPQKFDTPAHAIKALLSGSLDAVVCDSEPAKREVAAHPELKILPVALTMEEYAFAFNKKDAELLRKFNEELVKMRQSGRLQAIIAKYHKK